jgi:ligand-binding SRPBCC domain-containing protein
MKYLHRFRVKAPLASVAAFHQQATSMGAITPPPIRVEFHSVPATLSSGDGMDFTLWFGPLPIHWSAQIEDVSESGFIDRQLRGPFAEWVHRHSFVAVDEQTTEVADVVSLRLSPQPAWWLVGLGMQLSLPILFAYRGWKTRRILQ